MFDRLKNKYALSKATQAVESSFVNYENIINKIDGLLADILSDEKNQNITQDEYDTTINLIDMMIIDLKTSTIAIDALIKYEAKTHNVEERVFRKGRWGIFTQDIRNLSNGLDLWRYCSIKDMNVYSIPAILRDEFPPSFAKTNKVPTLHKEDINFNNVKQFSNTCVFRKVLDANNELKRDDIRKQLRYELCDIIHHHSYTKLLTRYEELSLPALYLLAYTMEILAYTMVDDHLYSERADSEEISIPVTTYVQAYVGSNGNYFHDDNLNEYIDEIADKTLVFINKPTQVKKT